MPHRVHTVRESQGKIQSFQDSQEKLGGIRGNQRTISIVWKNLCFPNKIRELLFLLNIYVTPANDCARHFSWIVGCEKMKLKVC